MKNNTWLQLIVDIRIYIAIPKTQKCGCNGIYCTYITFCCVLLRCVTVLTLNKYNVDHLDKMEYSTWDFHV